MKDGVCEIPGRGKGLVVVERLEQGEVVVGEEALVQASNHSDQGRRRGSANQGEYDLEWLDRQVSQLSEEERNIFLALNDSDPEGPEDRKNGRIYINNTFHEGLFPTAARINHGCLPNALLSSPDGHRFVMFLLSILSLPQLLLLLLILNPAPALIPIPLLLLLHLLLAQMRGGCPPDPPARRGDPALLPPDLLPGDDGGEDHQAQPALGLLLLLRSLLPFVRRVRQRRREEGDSPLHHGPDWKAL